MADKEDQIETPAITDMDVEAEAPVEKENGGSKREREDESGEEGDLKKAKLEESFEEERLKSEEGEKDEKEEIKEVKLGPKTFNSSIDMFDYFNKLLRTWSTDYDINKYEQMVLTDLIKKGHTEPERKVGCGIEAFEIRMHPFFKSRCFFIKRVDGSSDDFSFRKCVDAILPLPEEMLMMGGGGRRGGRGRGRGGGRGKGRGGRRN